MVENVKLFLEFSEQDFTTPYQLDLYHYWMKIKGGRLMPARADINVVDLKHILPTLMVLEYIDEEETFLFKLMGTTCVKYYGEKTGKTMNMFEEYRDAEKRLLRMVTEKEPYYVVGTLGHINKNYIHTSFIVLPLSDDNFNVNKVLVSHHFY